MIQINAAARPWPKLAPSEIAERLQLVAANLGVGTLVITTTVLIHTVGLIFLSWAMVLVIEWSRLHRHVFGQTIALVTAVLGLFFIHTIEVWVWALLYLSLGIVPTFEAALYFSTVTFSTVGYGDITPPLGWRLLCALEGVNGFLLIGWSVAYLVAASTRHGPFRAGEHF